MATKKATKKAPAKKKAAKTTKKVVKATAKKATKVKAKTKRKPNPSFMRPLTPSNELAVIVGNKPLPRTQVVKKMWEYIKKNKLQDAKDKRKINADDNLKAVFGGKTSVDMFKMAGLVNKHLS
ncbi:MAG: hypothetical protein A2504_11935 [Bdellovibrionales bacterium RIFOXYD12_FULL_39_22]|nr:MAG: hypothetical protein A2385_16450 [Bdellovibrionales bacterium RIFOXYB1_FULL_39_21]OFZ44453.1 MAG: hypothetical protein A2485_06445 [Bdellovibrionales bacterium RIFOXYC12_FULL_39_17]OFZ49905.1 MAG: hypothetical protein A2404_01020 [Bdellovibrionales bacterium RIFOXYC1_FULL_39_130]OFZ76910.1 MAG: hypothetical protein A2560_05820 [Bdellovibrionales bacterium RIFOXYD1_FULL_39_84]OFZ76961.1 MAG: hypothetical protein A2451_04715 [Bdellovibrionales bacterium RIFOXYC2_FULL_39_8]OFZ95837.1 MAG: